LSRTQKLPKHHRYYVAAENATILRKQEISLFLRISGPLVGGRWPPENPEKPVAGASAGVFVPTPA